jgi:hypothetical protein
MGLYIEWELGCWRIGGLEKGEMALPTVMIPILPLISNLISVYEDVEAMMDWCSRLAGHKGKTKGRDESKDLYGQKLREAKDSQTIALFKSCSSTLQFDLKLIPEGRLCPANEGPRPPRLGESWGFWGMERALETGLRQYRVS